MVQRPLKIAVVEAMIGIYSLFVLGGLLPRLLMFIGVPVLSFLITTFMLSYEEREKVKFKG